MLEVAHNLEKGRHWRCSSLPLRCPLHGVFCLSLSLSPAGAARADYRSRTRPSPAPLWCSIQLITRLANRELPLLPQLYQRLCGHRRNCCRAVVALLLTSLGSQRLSTPCVHSLLLCWWWRLRLGLWRGRDFSPGLLLLLDDQLPDAVSSLCAMCIHW